MRNKKAYLQPALKLFLIETEAEILKGSPGKKTIDSAFTIEDMETEELE
ncbi:MAG: hypothetical protein SOZ80_03750 [Prevotella sp.]|nr:hypothetical protein [Prevotella sp.]MDD7317271.1 hypothetical protein [Prevotellaceae bacterium]MDY4019875.1 hypothetical protein [Prevotella sp.]